MQTVYVADNIAKGKYQVEVIENGHIPGVLSGANLKGKAKQFAGKYERSRKELINRVEKYGVFDSIVWDSERKKYVRVWTDENGNPVCLRFESEKELA